MKVEFKAILIMIAWAFGIFAAWYGLGWCWEMLGQGVGMCEQDVLICWGDAINRADYKSTFDLRMLNGLVFAIVLFIISIILGFAYMILDLIYLSLCVSLEQKESAKKGR